MPQGDYQQINKINNSMLSPQRTREFRSASQKKLRSPHLIHPSFAVSNRTKSFKNHFLDTYNEAKRSSNVYEMAHSLYSKKTNQAFTVSNRALKGAKHNPEIKEQMEKERSASVKLMDNSNKRMALSLVNTPTRAKSPSPNILLENLSRRTTMLIEYRKEISQLEKEKQSVLDRIQSLKRKIINEKKLKSKLFIQSEKHMNSTEHGHDYKTKIKRETERNKEQQEENQEDCKKMVYYLTEADKQSQALSNEIEGELTQIEQLKCEISELIHSVFTENQELTLLKSNLSIALKSMKNSSDTIKYLQSQKADLLLFVNQQIQSNKVQKTNN